MDLVARLAASGLRGRGGGWFPAARKWQAVRVEGGEPVVIANGAEGEPGSVKDRWVMTHRASDVVRGLTIAAQALGAREAIIFLKRSFEGPARALGEAIAAGAAGSLPVRIERGDDSYIAGEETALLEALEGRRAWPRPKPPLPAAVGLHGRPTLVQNVETLARVPAAVAEGDAFARSERTLVSLWGDVARPGVHEVALGTAVREVVALGGGCKGGVALVFPGGPSAPPLTADQLDTPLHPDALRAARSGLGTASILVVSRDACLLSVAASAAAFFEREACGQCPPCVVGTQGLARVVRAVAAGTARGREMHDLAEIAGFMKDHGYCAHSRTAAAVVTGMLARIPAELESHLAGRGCAAGGRLVDPFAAGSPERRAIEPLA